MWLCQGTSTTTMLSTISKGTLPLKKTPNSWPRNTQKLLPQTLSKQASLTLILTGSPLESNRFGLVCQSPRLPDRTHMQKMTSWQFCTFLQLSAQHYIRELNCNLFSDPRFTFGHRNYHHNTEKALLARASSRLQPSSNSETLPPVEIKQAGIQ